LYAAAHGDGQDQAGAFDGKCHYKQEPQNDAFQPAGPFAQGEGELIFLGRELIVERVDLIQQGVHAILGIGNGGDLLVEVLSQGYKTQNRTVGLVPCHDGAMDVFIAVEPAEELDHAIDVALVVTAFFETLPGDGEIGVWLAQFNKGLVVTQVDQHKSLELRVVGFVMCVGVFEELVEAVLLCLGPQAFAADIGTDGGQGIDREKEDDQLYSDEQRHDPDREIEFFGNRNVPKPSENEVSHMKGFGDRSGLQSKEVVGENKEPGHLTAYRVLIRNP
jgi:hypothetical protein